MLYFIGYSLVIGASNKFQRKTVVGNEKGNIKTFKKTWKWIAYDLVLYFGKKKINNNSEEKSIKDSPEEK